MGFLSLIPLRDWLYGALIVAVSVLCWHFYDKYESAVNYANTVKAESKAALELANQHISDLTKDYAAARKADKEAYDKAIADAAVQHATDVGRLRVLAAARDADAVLHGSLGTAAEADAWAKRLGALESISSGLADALRADDATLADCWRERDSLTGK